jgi:type III pantothenate kinase
MLLAIDIGNTNIVFAVYEGNTCLGMWRAATDSRRTPDEYSVLLDHWLSQAGLHRRMLQDTAIASVVPSVTHQIERLVEESFGHKPLIIGRAGVDVGLAIALRRPEEVGADRIVNAVAAIQKYPLPLIVIDFGTATTFDVVDGQATYIGGVIAPGINLAADALHRASAKLPKVDICRPQAVIGADTVSAMQSGLFWGYVAMIEGLVAGIKAELDAAPCCIATGGLAALFAQATPVIQHLDNALTLRGLLNIYTRNRGALHG